MSRGANAGYLLDETAAYAFIRETTIIPRTYKHYETAFSALHMCKVVIHYYFDSDLK
jgi:hypothetical protein